MIRRGAARSKRVVSSRGRPADERDRQSVAYEVMAPDEHEPEVVPAARQSESAQRRAVERHFGREGLPCPLQERRFRLGVGWQRYDFEQRFAGGIDSLDGFVRVDAQTQRIVTGYHQRKCTAEEVDVHCCFNSAKSAYLVGPEWPRGLNLEPNRALSGRQTAQRCIRSMRNR